MKYFIHLLVFILLFIPFNQQGLKRTKTRQKRIKAPVFHLNDGCRIPCVGMGTWQLGSNDQEISRAISDAIDVGYRHIDTAWLYGTEKGLGLALSQALKSNEFKREDFYITSKVWNTYQRREKVLDSIKQSLNTLGLNYLDLTLIHWPTGFREGSDNYPKYRNGTIIPRKWSRASYIETWKGMEDAVEQGLTRSIGVSNFNARQLHRLLKNAKIKPSINQVECHPNLNQRRLLTYCNKRGIKLEAYAPLRRADKELLNDPILKGIADKYNKTSAQVVFRWQHQRGVVVIPKSGRKSRQLENIDIFDFQLTESEMNQINSLPQKQRIYDIEGIHTHPDYPFNAQY